MKLKNPKDAKLKIARKKIEFRYSNDSQNVE